MKQLIRKSNEPTRTNIKNKINDGNKTKKTFI